MESEGSKDSLTEEASTDGRFIRFAERILCRGASVTYKGIDTDEGCEIAWSVYSVKELDQGQLNMLQDRLSLLLSLNHPRIVRLLGGWVNPEARTLILITEALLGGTMREYLRRVKRPRLRLLKVWGREVLEGLQFLHSLRPPLVFREFKLENLIVNPHDGTVKIGDFAITCIAEYLDMQVLGAPEYCAPEALYGPYDEKADVYSFGMCMLEIATYWHPFKECTDNLTVMDQVAREGLPECYYAIADSEFKNLLDTCFRPALRRASARELLTHNFFRIREDDSRLCEPVALHELDVIPEEEEAFSCVSYLDEETIQISVMMKFRKNQLKQVTFPFSLRTDDAVTVALEMVKTLGLDSGLYLPLSQVIQQKVDEASGASTGRQMRRYSDSFKQTTTDFGCHTAKRWSVEVIRDRGSLTWRDSDIDSSSCDYPVSSSPLFK